MKKKFNFLLIAAVIMLTNTPTLVASPVHFSDKVAMSEPKCISCGGGGMPEGCGGCGKSSK